MKTIPYRLKHKLQEVYSLSPNDLGYTPLNYLYKTGSSSLKRMPFILIIPLSTVLAIMLYMLFGSLTVKLTTLLQYGF